MNFAELGLVEPIARAVAAAGYETPTPIQAQAIPHVLAGRDVLGSAQTGTGKTAAFALPILHRLCATEGPPSNKRRPIRALILSPTRELAMQIYENVRTYRGSSGLAATVVVGGVSQFHQVQALRKGVDILIATPGRLLDLVQQGHVRLSAVETVVLDEADHMLDLGFIPDVRRIFGLVPQQRQTLLFSATMPEAIRDLAASLLKDPAHVTVAPVRITTELIQQSLYHIVPGQKPQYLVHVLKTLSPTRVLVFTRTRRRADLVVRILQKANMQAVAIHGDKSQSARSQALARFKSNRPPILVATDIAARGIDVDNVSHVINYDLPQVPETYVHRIGRTGRAGASGVAVSLCDREERGLLVSIERLMRRNVPVEQGRPENLPAQQAEEKQPRRFDKPPRPAQGAQPARKHQPSQRGHHNKAAAHQQHGAPATGQRKRRRRPRRPVPA